MKENKKGYTSIKLWENNIQSLKEDKQKNNTKLNWLVNVLLQKHYEAKQHDGGTKFTSEIRDVGDNPSTN